MWICVLLIVQRVMPTSFFLLLRFFLRVDGVLIRINDTRLYHEASWFSPARMEYQYLIRSRSYHWNVAEVNLLWVLISNKLRCCLWFQAGKDYMLREFSTRESSIAELKVSYDKYYWCLSVICMIRSASCRCVVWKYKTFYKYKKLLYLKMFCKF